MKTVATTGYVFTCFLLIIFCLRHELFMRLDTKKRIYLLLGCVLLPGLYFGPYIAGLTPVTLHIPGWITWLPFFLFALTAILIKQFRPEKEKQVEKPLAFLVLGYMLFLNLLPFIAGMIGRM